MNLGELLNTKDLQALITTVELTLTILTVMLTKKRMRDRNHQATIYLPQPIGENILDLLGWFTLSITTALTFACMIATIAPKETAFIFGLAIGVLFAAIVQAVLSSYPADHL